jgi:hypothetical protein
LDAKSAFDKIVREFCIRNAFLAGSSGQGLVYLDNRMKSRLTYIEWDKILMGPVRDKLGVEQGGINSDRLYKLANNKELKITQQSAPGLKIGDIHCGSIGQADDVGLVSDEIHRLFCILNLAIQYAKEYHIEMVPEKTKLLCYTPRGQHLDTYYWQVVSPITMDGFRIGFSESAEHVGIIRSTQTGNLANVLARQAAHEKAVHAVLPAGLARGHQGNPAAALRVERLYGSPVLLRYTMLYTFTMIDNKGCKHVIQAYGIDQVTEDTVMLDLSGIMEVFPGAPKEVHLSFPRLKLTPLTSISRSALRTSKGCTSPHQLKLSISLLALCQVELFFI